MKTLIVIFLAFIVGSGLYAQLPDTYNEQQTSAGNISGTITNLGTIGNAFSGSFNVEGRPSFEYPAGSGVEHIFDGGLWVGGLVDGEIGVSTGAVDDASGYATGKQGFEFTSKNPLAERSSLFDSPFYDPNAVSHQDFYSSFFDIEQFFHFNTSYRLWTYELLRT